MSPGPRPVCFDSVAQTHDPSQFPEAITIIHCSVSNMPIAVAIFAGEGAVCGWDLRVIVRPIVAGVQGEGGRCADVESVGSAPPRKCLLRWALHPIRRHCTSSDRV